MYNNPTFNPTFSALTTFFSGRSTGHAVRIQRQVKLRFPEMNDDDMLYCDGVSAERIQAALSKWKIEKLGDTYYRFCDIDDPDLKKILGAFGIDIPNKCYKISEIKQLKAKMEMST